VTALALAPERADKLLLRLLEGVAIVLASERLDLGPCWLWNGSLTPDGYANLQERVEGVDVNHLGHRLAYEQIVGPVPPGLDLDHLCRFRRCVRPGHLEPTTRRENLLRGETIPARNAAKTHCPAGHPYDEENTYWHRGGRHCKACARRHSAAAGRRRRARERKNR
jgi:hypothetical protein